MNVIPEEGAIYQDRVEEKMTDAWGDGGDIE